MTGRARTLRSHRRVAAGMAIAAAALAACHGAPRLPERPNVVLIVVDTLRADRLSLYGYERDTSPELERFAAERALVFERALSNAGCTYPSIASMLTGVWPQRVTARFRELSLAIPPNLPSLAERLAARGYATAAVSASSIVRKSPSKNNPRGGYERGFGSFDESCLIRPASCVNERAFERFAALPEPFFLYLHYLDPHAPYRPPEKAPRAYSRTSRAAARGWARRGEPYVIQKRLDGDAKAGEFDQDDVRHLSNLYDDEVRYFDGRFGELVGELDRRGLSERTVIVVAADHGEELYDHERWAHCGNLAFDTILATPLLFGVPGVQPSRRKEVVSNVDLLPTLLALTGTPYEPGTLDGRSLAPLVDGSARALPQRTAFASQGMVRAASDGQRLVRFDLRTLGSEVAPLRLPGARATAANPDDPAVTALRRALLAWIRQVEGAGAEQSGVRRAEEIERQLRAVGYL